MNDTDDAGLRRVALLLGALGLVPFVAATLAAVFPPTLTWHIFGASGLKGYGAVILSFLGGIHWGLAMRDGDARPGLRLAVAVIPAVVAWGALLLPWHIGIMVLGAAFIGQLGVDLHAVRGGRLPGWYGILRWVLTLVVLACFGAALAAA